VKKFNFKWKDAIIIGGVFVAYKLYELYRTGSELILNFKSAKFVKFDLDTYGRLTYAVMDITYSLFNTTKNIIPLRGMTGKIKMGGQTLGFIEKGGFSIGQGDNNVTFRVILQGEQVLEFITQAVKSKVPTLEFEITYKLPFFSYTDRFLLPPSDYMTKDMQNLLSFLR
jgi:hypothetical protein